MKNSGTSWGVEDLDYKERDLKNPRAGLCKRGNLASAASCKTSHCSAEVISAEAVENPAEENLQAVRDGLRGHHRRAEVHDA